MKLTMNKIIFVMVNTPQPPPQHKTTVTYKEQTLSLILLRVPHKEIFFLDPFLRMASPERPIYEQMHKSYFIMSTTHTNNFYVCLKNDQNGLRRSPRSKIKPVGQPVS